jgi:hypothetical protein
LDLTDKKGIPVAIKMNMALSPIPEPDDYIKEFMKRVDADVARLSSNDVVLSTISMLGPVLQLTKTIIDKFSPVQY